jgi:hypothetical protein
MTQHRSVVTFVSVVLVTCVLATVSYGQSSQSANKAAQPSPNPQAGTFPKNPEGPPSVMHWCAANCFTLNWVNGHYVALDNGQPLGSVWTVGKFTPGSVVIFRKETAATAVLTGQISSGGNSIVNGRITWTSGVTGTFPYQAAWGTALNALPGSNAERDSVKVSSVPCDSSSTAPAAQALQRGVQSIQSGKADIGICWLRIAAKQGDVGAQGVLSVILYRGMGVAPDQTEAFAWAQRASAQGNYLGESALALMYANGEGVPKDPSKAEYWKTKGEQDRLAYIQATQQPKSQRPVTMQDFMTLMDTKTPWGYTPGDALRALIPTQLEGNMFAYQRYNDECRAKGNHRLEARHLRESLIANGVDVP